MEKDKKPIKLNRTGNAVRNMASGAVNKLVTLFFPYLLRAVMIRVLGIEYAGLSGLFVSILDVLNLTESGMGTAVVSCMYRPIAQGDEKTVCALLNLFRKMYYAIGTVVLVLGIAVMPFLKYLIKDQYPADINLYLLYFIYLLNSCVSYFFMGYKSAVLCAYQRLDVMQNVATVVKGGMYLTQIAVLLLYRNYYIYAVMLPIFTAIINLITAYETAKLFPQYTCRGQISGGEKKELKEKVSGLMITRLCAVSRNSFDNIFISSFIGLTMTAVYSNYYYIMYSIHSLLGIIVQAVLAGVGNSIQTDTAEHNYNDLKRFNFMYLWISGVCTVCFLCLVQPFMVMWMGSGNMLPLSSVILLSMYLFLCAMGDMQSVYYNAAGLWWHYRKCTIVEALLNLVLNFVLVWFCGLNGVILGTLISMFLVNFVYSERLVFRYYFRNGKAKEFYLLQIKYAVVVGVSCFVTYFFCHLIPCSGDAAGNIRVLLERGVICLILPNVIYFLLYRKSEEFQSAYEWVKEKVDKSGFGGRTGKDC